MKAPLPFNEQERLAALHRYEILDTSPELAYDRITRLASRFFSVPTALVSLIDDHRQWFKSACGLNLQQTDRDLAFCAYTLLSNTVLCIPDATQDFRFSHNSLVVSSPYLRFYAGAPLRDPDGFVLGTLCILDYEARPTLTTEEIATLEDLAALVMDELALRMSTRSLISANKRLEQLASTDLLTSLPNRFRFEHELEQQIEAMREKSLAVLYMDLDRFKSVNDGAGGHAAGDMLLQKIAQEMSAQLPVGALLARMGGDEFVAVIPGIGTSEAEEIASALCTAANNPISIGAHVFRPGVSIGIAIFPEDGENALELVREADHAMYKSKSHGGGCYRLASQCQS